MARRRPHSSLLFLYLVFGAAWAFTTPVGEPRQGAPRRHAARRRGIVVARTGELASAQWRRREILVVGVFGGSLWGGSLSAAANSNPLGLRGSYWETGKLYKKDDVDMPTDPAELLKSIKEARAQLSTLQNPAELGRYSEIQAGLRVDA